MQKRQGSQMTAEIEQHHDSSPLAAGLVWIYAPHLVPGIAANLKFTWQIGVIEPEAKC
jgi:hypothetical protein